MNDKQLKIQALNQEINDASNACKKYEYSPDLVQIKITSDLDDFSKIELLESCERAVKETLNTMKAKMEKLRDSKMEELVQLTAQ